MGTYDKALCKQPVGEAVGSGGKLQMKWKEWMKSWVNVCYWQGPPCPGPVGTGEVFPGWSANWQFIVSTASSSSWMFTAGCLQPGTAPLQTPPTETRQFLFPVLYIETAELWLSSRCGSSRVSTVHLTPAFLYVCLSSHCSFFTPVRFLEPSCTASGERPWPWYRRRVLSLDYWLYVKSLPRSPDRLILATILLLKNVVVGNEVRAL